MGRDQKTVAADVHGGFASSGARSELPESFRDGVILASRFLRGGEDRL